MFSNQLNIMFWKEEGYNFAAMQVSALDPEKHLKQPFSIYCTRKHMLIFPVSHIRQNKLKSSSVWVLYG